MSIQANFPNVQPSLLLDFANAKQLPPQVTFTRPTSATYYDGHTTAMAEQNLFLQSQTFDVSPWVGAGTIITPNTATAPDGTLTAETYDQGTSSGYHERYQSVVLAVGQTYTLSVYAKNVDGTYLNITMYSTSNVYAGAIFNLSTGAVTTTGAATWPLVSSNITSVGNSWYRCSITFTVTTLVNLPTFSIVVPNSTTIGEYGLTGVFTGANKQIYIWGAQLEQRSSATAYTATTTQPITNYIPVLLTAGGGQPRFDHNPTTSESLGLEIEEQRTNVIIYSANPSNAAWVKSGATITSLTVVAPDGTLSGAKSVEDTEFRTHGIYQSITLSASTTYTWSIYLKKAERTRIQFYAQTSTVEGAIFDLATGTISDISAGVSASMYSVGNDWYRCSLTRITTVSDSGGFLNIFSIQGSSGSTSTYTGNGFSGFYVWGAQIEVGAFATSYIPTTTAAATRAADDASMTGTNFSSWFQQQQGSLYIESNFPRVGTRTPAQFASSTSNRYGFFFSNTFFNYFDGGVYGVSSIASTASKIATSLVNYDIAVSFNNNAAIAVTGAKSLSNVDTFNIGRGFGVGEYICGTIKKIAYYPVRVTNAQLQALTS
jgi:hypothetical protein